MGKTIAQTGSLNNSPAATSYVELETSGNVSEHTTLEKIRDLFAATFEALANKDATGGYAGLTLFKINFKNAANTFTSFFTNTNTAARTYTFQDRNGTIADDTDLALKAPLASPTFTGTVTLPKTTEIQDTSADHQYVLAVSELAADRTVTLPLLTGNDEFTFNSHTQTLANKTLTKPVINATNPTAATYTPSSGSQTVTIDCSTSNTHFVSGHASGTAITFAITNATNNQPFIISVTQGSGTLSTIAAWFATVRWPAGTTPTFTATLNKRDVFGFIRTGTDTYDGFIIGQNL